MGRPLRVGVLRLPVCDLPPIELSAPGEAPQLLGGGLLLMALTVVVRVAHLAAGGLRRVGLSPLVGVARPPVAGSRRMGLPAASAVQLAAVGFRLAGAAAVAAGRALVELARPGAWGPHPVRACR